MNAAELAAMIDHTALKPDTTPVQIEELCAQAHEYSFAAVCVAPFWVAKAARLLEGTPVQVATVVGFPHGHTLSAVKALETRLAIRNGASEIDMVINIGALKDGDEDNVFADIAQVAKTASESGGALVKVILETALLTDAEIVRACRICEEAGADYVKTSTGFADGGASTQVVALMRQTVGDRLGVKASGGIRDLSSALALIEAGASRLGCSSSVAIVQELQNSRR